MFVKKWALLLIIVATSGCKLYESLGGMPTSTDELEIDSGISTERIFECSETSIKAIPEPSNWHKDVRRKNIQAGVLETGNFDQPNVIGFRARIKVDQINRRVMLKIKGAGPYFMDLGVDNEMIKLKADLLRCIEN